MCQHQRVEGNGDGWGAYAAPNMHTEAKQVDGECIRAGHDLPLCDRVCTVWDHGCNALYEIHWEGIKGRPWPLHALSHCARASWSLLLSFLHT